MEVLKTLAGCDRAISITLFNKGSNESQGNEPLEITKKTYERLVDHRKFKKQDCWVSYERKIVKNRHGEVNEIQQDTIEIEGKRPAGM